MADQVTGQATETHQVVVEFDSAVYAALDGIEAADGMNKSTVVNRAVQLYGMLRALQERGGVVKLMEPGEDNTLRRLSTQ